MRELYSAEAGYWAHLGNLGRLQGGTFRDCSRISASDAGQVVRGIDDELRFRAYIREGYLPTHDRPQSP